MSGLREFFDTYKKTVSLAGSLSASAVPADARAFLGAKDISHRRLFSLFNQPSDGMTMRQPSCSKANIRLQPNV